MICPECKGKGEVRYYRETYRDEYSVTVKGVVDVCHTCHGSGVKPPTIADHIRSLSDEELAVFIADEIPHGDCYDCDLECRTYREGDKFYSCCQNAFYKWLKQPYKEEA